MALLEATSRAMQRYGWEQREYYVWWGGYFTADGDGQVVTALCPEAETTFGRIHLSNSQLAVLHTQLRDLDQVLLVELHTHPPGAGGQNEVDAAHPASTHIGFITIVVPDFAFPASTTSGIPMSMNTRATASGASLTGRRPPNALSLRRRSFPWR